MKLLKKCAAVFSAFAVMLTSVPIVNNDTAEQPVISAIAAEEGTYTYLKYVKYIDHVEITGAGATPSEVIIPEKIEGLPVTVIGKSAFAYATMVSVTIPDIVQEIGTYAFKGCTLLEEVILPDGITSLQGTFQNCSNLKKAVLPDSITTIGNSTFENCQKLSKIKLPEQLTSIGADAFYDCYALELETTILPENLTSIGVNAFHFCYLLKSITFPSKLQKIPAYCFAFCGFKDITIPENITQIDEEAFVGCKLESVTINTDMKEINVDSIIVQDMFNSNANYFKSITFGENVTDIAPNRIRLSACPNLTQVTVLNKTCNISYDSKYSLGTPGTTTIYGYSGSTAQTYAKTYGYDFVSIGNFEETTTATTTTATTTTAATTTAKVTTSTTSVTTQKPVATTPIPDYSQNQVVVAIDQQTFTPDQLKALNYKVPVFVRLEKNPGITAAEFGIEVSDNLTYKIITVSNTAWSIAEDAEMILGNVFTNKNLAFRMTIADSDKENASWASWANDTACTQSNANLLLLEVELPSTVSGGEHFDILYRTAGVGIDGKAHVELWRNGSENYVTAGAVSHIDGWIEIEKTVAVTTTTPTTTTTTTTTTKATTTKATTTTTKATTSTFTTSTSITTTIETKALLSVKENEITLKAGQQYQIEANQTNLTYSSNHTDIAVVSSSGIITALKEGNAVISIINQNYDVVQINLTVISDNPEPELELGDLTQDEKVDASDAAMILVAAARQGSGLDSGLTEAQKTAADVNHDGKIDASDAAYILQYAAAKGAGAFSGNLSDFMNRIPETTETTTTTTTTTIQTTTTTTTTTTATTTTTTTTETTTTTRKPPSISSCSIEITPGQYEGYLYTLNISGNYDYYYIICNEYGISEPDTPYTVFSKNAAESSLYLTGGSSLERVTVSVTPYYEDGTKGDTITRTVKQPVTAVSMPENCIYMGIGVPLSDDGFVNLRSSMSLSDNIITEIPNSTRIKMYYISNATDWVFVEYGEYAGYAKRSYVKLIDAQGVWADGKNAYDAELQEFGYDQILKSKSSILFGGYELLDLNQDEIPELIVDTSENGTEGGRQIAFYTYSNGKPLLMGDGFSGWEASFMWETQTKQFVTIAGRMGYGKITWYQCNKNSIWIQKEQEFSYSDMDDFKIAYSKYGNFTQIYTSSSYD